MSRYVFIIGAGASFDAGAPLMSNFLDRAEDYLHQNRFGISAKQIKELFDLRSKMRLVYANSRLDLQNIESLLSAIEMGITIGRIGDYSKKKLDTLLKAAELMIVQTIEQSIEFEINHEGPFQITNAGEYRRTVRPPEKYMNFIKRVHEKFGSDVAFITFNYDVALDLTLLSSYGKINYCLSGLPKDKYEIPLCKLHGSVNWAISSSIKQLDICDLAKYLQPMPHSFKQDAKLNLEFSKEFNTRFSNKYRPVIVPPTWNKTARHRWLPNVWSSAAEYLRNATHIFVIGYSLPPSDSFFHHMFALSTMQNNQIRRFVVTDIDQNVENRFRDLLGPGILSRFVFDKRSFDEVGRYSSIKIFE